MGKQEISYKAAINEVEEILEKIEEGELDVDELTRNVKRVTELLKICKTKLQKTESEVTKILEEDE
ncbi:exodeoxyribonuclease VII small subunit [Bacteroidota bacterium]